MEHGGDGGDDGDESRHVGIVRADENLADAAAKRDDEQRARRHPRDAERDADDRGDARAIGGARAEKIPHANVGGDAKRHRPRHERQAADVEQRHVRVERHLAELRGEHHRDVERGRLGGDHHRAARAEAGHASDGVRPSARVGSGGGDGGEKRSGFRDAASATVALGVHHGVPLGGRTANVLDEEYEVDGAAE